MKTVIGLYHSHQAINEQYMLFEQAGFTKDHFSVISEDKPARCLLGCDPTKIVTRYASWGAITGIIVYGVFILFAAWCDCTIYSISQVLASEIVIVGILAGSFVGGLLGVFIGYAEYEKDTHLYLQGIQLGDKLFVLETEKKDAEKAVQVLEDAGCLGVRMLPDV